MSRDASAWRRFRPLLVAMLLLLAEAWLLRVRYAAPAPLDERAPATQFSARRALAALTRVLGDQTPHPTGSPANERVRERLRGELASLGLQVQELRGMACGPWGFCAEAHDLLATIPGSEAGSWMLAAHYDSVPAGPGAADDGAGVGSLLEIARALRQAPVKHGVLLLFTDGEELGGLGAQLFVQRYRDLSAVRAVINVEARGTSGPAILFETSEPNSDLIARYASAASHPLTSSAAYTVYKALPNDTDLTIFRERGMAGYNFAFIGAPERYHTAVDDLAHLDAGSVQSSGSSALALLRELDARGVGDARENAVWFDLFGFGVARWPERTAWLTTLFVTALLLLGTVRGWSKGALTPRTQALALTLLPLALLLATIAGWLLLALTASAAPANWIARPAALEACCLLAAALALAVGSALVAEGSGAAAGLNADALWWTLLSLLTTAKAPGTSFLFVSPALCAGAALIFVADARYRAHAAWFRVLLAVVTGAVWFPALYFMYDAVGINLPWLATVSLALVLSPLAPLVPRLDRRPFLIAALCAGATTLLALAARQLAPFSHDAPQRLNLAYHLDADSGQARFLVDANGGPISEPLRRAGSLAANETDPYPWFGGWGRKALAGPAPALALPAPTATVLESTTTGAERHIKLHISSARGALAISLGMKVRPTHITLDGMRVSPWQQGDAWVVSKCGDTLAGADVELTAPASAALELLVFDHSTELPMLAAPLRAARGPNANASQTGDVTVVSRAVRL